MDGPQLPTGMPYEEWQAFVAEHVQVEAGTQRRLRHWWRVGNPRIRQSG
jgi:hypothetical protein